MVFQRQVNLAKGRLYAAFSGGIKPPLLTERDDMSRIGRKLIDLPAGVTVQTEGASLAVKGPKGTLHVPLPVGIQLEKQDGHLTLQRDSDDRAARYTFA